jgi:hypothetical protein
MEDDKELKQIGQFKPLTWVPGAMEGNNFVRKLHVEHKILGFDKPDDIGMRMIEIPPFGEIPVHNHDTDDFSSWVICLNGSGHHLVKFGETVYEHGINAGDGSVSTQKMLAKYNSLNYEHGFRAGEQGMILLYVYRESQISDERLREIQSGK